MIKSLEDLKKIKEEALKETAARNNEGTKIIIGMGTCGIAAGAREVLAKVIEEVDKRNANVNITQTGCIGMCEKEVLIDIVKPGKARITYGNVIPSIVPKIIAEHVINDIIVEEYVIAKLEE